MTGFLRPSGRRHDELRNIEFVVDFTKWAEGSVLASFGETRVLCTASVDERVPPWLKETRGQGWITAEYAMLPRATDRRTQRESVQGKIGGRTHEISRLIGRSLRGVVDMKRLGERTITLDCDVLQADGGTRTAAISGAHVAMSLAVAKLIAGGRIEANPIRDQIAAVSLGLIGETVLLDLDFAEDQRVDTDLNLVMTKSGGIVEIQGTAEKAPFRKEALEKMVGLGAEKMARIFDAQKAALVQKP